MMRAASSVQTVPDHEVLLNGLPEEPFYPEMFASQPARVAPTEAADSEAAPDEGKVLMPLLPERRLFSQSGISPDTINIHSWKTRHPTNWLSQDIANWIYYVCSQLQHIDSYKVRAENFNTLRGDRLCAMTADDFLRLEPNYGRDLYWCLQELLKPANYKAPVDSIEMIQGPYEEDCTLPGYDTSKMWSSTAVNPDEDLEMAPFGPVDLDFDRVESGFAIIGDRPYDIVNSDRFDEFPYFDESGYESAKSSESATSTCHVDAMSCSSGELFAQNHVTDSVHPDQIQTGGSPAAYDPSRPSAVRRAQAQGPKPRGRPRQNGHTPGQRGRKPGQSTKGNHLWKFIRDVINDSRYNPDVIRWENREQGIFRIVNSAEIARLWGQTKNNSSMTYEKFSRAMRYCRKQGDFGPLPRDQNLPKKLCFRFGSKKWTP